jgi:molecular chaperone HscB
VRAGVSSDTMSDYNPAENFFVLMGLPQQYSVDLAALTARYRELQSAMHPDRHVTASERERLLAVQKSSQINEAYEVLRSPTRRAAYLLTLAGVDSDMSSTTFRDPEFLMQQISLREELSELSQAADPEAALDRFYQDVDAALVQHRDQFARCYDGADYNAAREAYAKLQFLDKLRYEAEQQENELLDY